MNPRLRAVLIPLALLPLGGCAALGGLGGAAAGGIGSLFQLALYLAAVAAPLYLSYYLYNKDKD